MDKEWLKDLTTFDPLTSIRVTKDMVDRVNYVLQHTKAFTVQYYDLKDFLDVLGGATEVCVHIDHFKHIKYVFCIGLSGRDECEIFGSGEFDCPYCQARSIMPVCPFWDGG